MTQRSPFCYFTTGREIIRLAVMMYVRFRLSLRNVEDLLHERGIDVSHETVRFCWHLFGPLFASEVRKRRVEGMRSSRGRWPQLSRYVALAQFPTSPGENGGCLES